MFTNIERKNEKELSYKVFFYIEIWLIFVFYFENDFKDNINKRI